jgi:hypothetical protein
LWCEDSAIDVVNCTFYGNSGGGLGSGGGGVHAEGSAVVTIGNTIMVSNDSYPFGPVSCGGTSTATLTCCDLYGNEGGDWVDCTAGQAGINGNISRDPLFCDAPSRDFRIDLNSPCRPHPPENPDCDLIGAAPVGCGSTPTKLTTWGRLKSSYR